MSQDMKKVVEYVGGEPVVKFMKGDGYFDESKHPRDDTGRFTDGGAVPTSEYKLGSKDKSQARTLGAAYATRVATENIYRGSGAKSEVRNPYLKDKSPKGQALAREFHHAAVSALMSHPFGSSGVVVSTK